MTDEEIIQELQGQIKYWQEQISETTKRLADYKRQHQRSCRLLEAMMELQEKQKLHEQYIKVNLQ